MNLRGWINQAKLSSTDFILCLIFVKLLVTQLTSWDCLGAFIFILAAHSQTIVSYLFPKRVDLYVEVSEVQELIYELQAKSEEFERDLTALKFERGLKSK